MTKKNRMLEAYVKSLIEIKRINKVIKALPYGYISVKNISGRTYYYRQWRDGKKILSDYVPEAYYRIVEQKINIRKEYEKLLQIIEEETKKYQKTMINKKVNFNKISEEVYQILDNLDIDLDDQILLDKVFEKLN